MIAVDTATLESNARSVAEVLERHNIFGREHNDVTAQAKTIFTNLVLRQASPEITLPLILNIEETGVHIELDTKIVAGTAFLSMLRVSPNPTLPCDPEIDYEALATELDFIRFWLEIE